MTEPSWWTYLKATAGTEDGAIVASAAGVSAPQASRWKNGHNRPDADKLVRFARHYGKPPVAALIAAGYITAEESAEAIEVERDLAEVDAAELLAEIRRRMYKVSKLVDLWESAAPLSTADRMDRIDRGELPSVVVKLAAAVTAYTEDLVGGRDRMSTLVEARTNERDQRSGQQTVFDVIKQIEERDHAVEAESTARASTQASEDEEALAAEEERDITVGFTGSDDALEDEEYGTGLIDGPTTDGDEEDGTPNAAPEVS